MNIHEMNIDEPSLYELYEFIKYNRYFFDQDEKKAIETYLNDTTANYSGGHYWLKGQLHMLPDAKITEEKIQKAIEIDNMRIAEYGGPCNGMEAASINHHNYKFENLQKVLKKYYELMELESLRPPDATDPNDRGGYFYQKISKQTPIGK
jgi:hypothetical protein